MPDVSKKMSIFVLIDLRGVLKFVTDTWVTWLTCHDEVATIKWMSASLMVCTSLQRDGSNCTAGGRVCARAVSGRFCI